MGNSYRGALMTFVVISAAGCHNQVPPLSPTARGAEDPCWWTVMRSPLSPDSLALSFQQAFKTVGLTNPTMTRLADTAWVRAGPTRMAESAGAIYESRVVAYWHGDSTHYRQYVAITRQPGDSVNFGQRSIPFCAATARAASVRGSAPQAPTGEETLKIWTRRP
jgi:hypothetical protein